MDEKKLEDRNFVAFDAAVIDRDTIVAAVEVTQEVRGSDGVAQVPITVVLLNTGSRVTLGGTSRDKFIHWWKETVSALSVKLPEPPASEVVVEAEATTPVATAPPLPTLKPATKTPTRPAPSDSGETPKLSSEPAPKST